MSISERPTVPVDRSGAVVEYGEDASLRDIAGRADVWIGTLCRHFPTREALLETLLPSEWGRDGPLKPWASDDFEAVRPTPFVPSEAESEGTEDTSRNLVTRLRRATPMSGTSRGRRGPKELAAHLRLPPARHAVRPRQTGALHLRAAD